MGDHCAHDDDPRRSEQMFFYRDSVYVSRGSTRGNVGILKLVRRTEIFGDTNIGAYIGILNNTVIDWVATRPLLYLF